MIEDLRKWLTPKVDGSSKAKLIGSPPTEVGIWLKIVISLSDPQVRVNRNILESNI